MHIKNKRGQSTVEYVLLVTAVVAVMIAFVTKPGSGLQGQLGNTLNTTTNDMNVVGAQLAQSHQGHASTDPGTPTGWVVNPTK